MFPWHQESLAQWKKLFLLASAIYAVGALTFVIFGSARQEDWGVVAVEKSSLVSFRHPDSDSSDNEDAKVAEMHLM